MRYSDDYLVLCNSREEAESADRLIKEFLKEPLCLNLNKSDLSPHHIDEGFVFLGVLFCGNKRAVDSGKREKMKKKIKITLMISSIREKTLPAHMIRMPSVSALWDWKERLERLTGL